MKTHPLVAALAATLAAGVAGAQAQPPAVATDASPALSASSEEVTMSARGGAAARRTLTVTAPAGAPSGTLRVTLGRTGGALGQLGVDQDGCSGVALAPDASCKLALRFESACPAAETSSWTILVTGTGAQPVAVSVTGKSLGGDCS